jgi:hypothetical protein
MIGRWKLEGKIVWRDAHHEVEAEWVLNHQFVRIHEKTEDAAPASEKRYEAIWFLGSDPVSERYVVHLLDVFGGRFSETLGYGTRDGNAIHFVFEYRRPISHHLSVVSRKRYLAMADDAKG